MFYQIKALCQTLSDNTLTSEKLNRLVRCRLKKVLIAAYNDAPHYSKIMKKVGYNPNVDYTGVNDLEKLPALSKWELNGIGHDLINRNDQTHRPFHEEGTSGSSGIPLHVYRGKYERSIQIAKWLRVLLVNGYRGHQKVMSFSNSQRLVNKSSLIQRLGFCRRKTINYYQPISQLTDALFAYRPHILYGNRCHLELVAMDIKKRGLKCNFITLILAGGEVIHEHSRRLFREQYGAELVEYYGAVETGIMAYETPEHNGLRLFEDQIFYEIVDEAGEPVQAGTPGRLIVTDLSMRLMPVIRYDIGDIVVYEEQSSATGGMRRRLKKIIGRDDDYIVMPDGSLEAYTAFLPPLRQIPGIHQFRIIQKTPYLFQIEIAMNKGHFNRVKERIGNTLSAAFPYPLKFNIQHVECIFPEKSGKIRKFMSEVASSPTAYNCKTNQ